MDRKPEEAPSNSQEPRGKALPGGELAHLIPAELAKKIEDARNQQAMVGERRVVTILFCDLAGSTAAASQMDPEAWGEIVNEVLQVMIQPVYKYEGIVARLMGDAILAFFGAPIAHEDDPQRAILAGLEIQGGMEKLREKKSQPLDSQLEVRVGIHTGLVMVGQVGNDLQMEYTALGDAINLAARMEQTAIGGMIQVSEETYRLTSGLFEFQDIGEIQVKGKGMIHTYQPVGVKSKPLTRKDASVFHPMLIGRDEQLSRVNAAIQELKRGVGRIVWITGEAGIGKTRFVQEIKRMVLKETVEGEQEAAPEVAWHETSSFSYETHKPYALFRRLFAQAWNILPGDISGEIRGKIAAGLTALNPQLPEEYQETLERLIGTKDEPLEDRDGENYRDKLFACVLEVSRLFSGQTPVILSLDDLHWADPASLDLLQELYSLPDRYPILILCVMRKDAESPGWSSQLAAESNYPHRFTRIELRPLSPRDSDRLMNELLPLCELPDLLQSRIRETTEGNPFFIEEVVRELIDGGALVEGALYEGALDEPSDLDGSRVEWKFVGKMDDLHIPDSLHTLLTARIDRLDPHTRKTLQAASVIGRSFYYKILEDVNHFLRISSNGLDRELLLLQRSDIIRETARFPELEFIFSHSLTQEAAYNTLLFKQRREYHLHVGEAIERLFPDRLEEFHAILAHHFQAAKDRRALKYETLSGDDAMRLYALPVAADHYRKALDLAKENDQGVDMDSVRFLYLRLGRVYELQSEPKQALELYGEMRERATEWENDSLKLAALAAQGALLAIPARTHDPESARKLSDQALELARRLGDRKTEAKILWSFMLMNNYSGYMQRGIPYGEESVHIAREEGLREQLAHSLQDLAHAYMGSGRMEDARRVLDESREIWREYGNKPMLVENLMRSVYDGLESGKFHEGLAASEEGLRLAEESRNDWSKTNSQLFANLIRIATGDLEAAIHKLTWIHGVATKVGHPAVVLFPVQMSIAYENLGMFDQAYDYAEAAERTTYTMLPFGAIGLSQLAKLHLSRGDVDRAWECIQKSQDMESGESLFFMDRSRNVTRIEVILTRGEIQEAEKSLDQTMEEIQATAARYFLPELFWLKARLEEERGHLGSSIHYLDQAYQIAAEMDFLSISWKILHEMSRIADLLGEPVQSESWRAEGSKVIESIGGKIQDEEMRTHFLQFAASFSGKRNFL